MSILLLHFLKIVLENKTIFMKIFSSKSMFTVKFEQLSVIFFLACLHVACVVQQKDARQWFAELSVDMEKVLFFFEDVVSLYSSFLPGPCYVDHAGL